MLRTNVETALQILASGFCVSFPTKHFPSYNYKRAEELPRTLVPLSRLVKGAAVCVLGRGTIGHMPYELAKQLKDARFPQEGGMRAYRDGLKMDCKEPTLEELIEACGRVDLYVQRDGETVAVTAVGTKFFKEKASTPTEAVAKLWLALNKPTVQ